MPDAMSFDGLSSHGLALLIFTAIVFAVFVWGRFPISTVCLGILIAAIARTEAQIGGIAGLVLWVLAFLGGCFIPLFLINDSLATIGQLTPHFWAVTGFYDLLTRGLGLASIVDSLAALVAFSAVFFIIGAWRFEFD